MRPRAVCFEDNWIILNLREIIIIKIVDYFRAGLGVKAVLGVLLFSASILDVFGEGTGSDFQLSSAISAQIVHRCSINKDAHLSCLNINEDECISIFSNIYNSCDADSSELLFDEEDQQSVDAFTTCVGEKLTDHFVAKGVDLDATCE